MALTKINFNQIKGAVFNALDYGADNTGTTECAAAIQAAITAAAAASTDGAVYLPAGTYWISTALTIPYGVSMYGDGAVASTISCLSCNGLNFTSGSYDNGNMFYEDFGLVGRTGSSANWGAIQSILPAGGVSGVDSRDGLHFSRLKIRDFNQAFIIAATWEWSVTHCQITKINQAFNFGDYTMVSRIFQNYIIHEGGDSFSGTADIDCFVLSGPVVEGMVITQNQSSGFNRNLVINSATFVIFNDNDLQSANTGIYISTHAANLSIRNNYVEVDGAAGVAGLNFVGQNSELDDQICIEGNYFIATLSVSGTGMLLSSAGLNYAWHCRIVGNYFTGWASNDIHITNAGKTVIENNRCLSTGPTNSISVLSIQGPLVTVDKNECKKLLTYSGSDLTSGLLNLGANNLNSAVTAFPDNYGTWTPTISATLGAPATYTSTGRWQRFGNQIFLFCSFTLTGGTTWQSVAGSYVAGMAGAVYNGSAVVANILPDVATTAMLQAINYTKQVAANNGGYGTCMITPGGTDMITPIWAASGANDSVVITGSYRV